MPVLRLLVDDVQRDWNLYTDALTYGFICTGHRLIDMTSYYLECQTRLQSSKFRVYLVFLGRWSQKQYINWLRTLLSTASKRLDDAKTRYMGDYDNQIQRRLLQYVAGDQRFIERETALRNDEESDANRIQNKLAPRTRIPLHVAAMDSNSVTLA